MSHHTFFHFTIVTFSVVPLAFFVLNPLAYPSFAQEPEKGGVGFIVSGQATAKEVGLPVYPGSKPHIENTNDSQSARLGLWGGGSGFKLAVLKMESADSPEKLAAFYKKALAHYGKVLDCSNASPSLSDDDKKDSSATLKCGNDRPEKGGMLFKSGSKEKQHIVAIQPNGKGSVYQVIALGSWGTDSRQ
jgi:hypothetical protein